jgi:hypothetical protein
MDLVLSQLVEDPLGHAPRERDELLSGGDEGGDGRVEVSVQRLLDPESQRRGRNPVADGQVAGRYPGAYVGGEGVERRVLHPESRYAQQESLARRGARNPQLAGEFRCRKQPVCVEEPFGGRLAVRGPERDAVGGGEGGEVQL